MVNEDSVISCDIIAFWEADICMIIGWYSISVYYGTNYRLATGTEKVDDKREDIYRYSLEPIEEKWLEIHIIIKLFIILCIIMYWYVLHQLMCFVWVWLGSIFLHSRRMVYINNYNQVHVNECSEYSLHSLTCTWLFIGLLFPVFAYI